MPIARWNEIQLAHDLWGVKLVKESKKGDVIGANIESLSA